MFLNVSHVHRLHLACELHALHSSSPVAEIDVSFNFLYDWQGCYGQIGPLASVTAHIANKSGVHFLKYSEFTEYYDVLLSITD